MNRKQRISVIVGVTLVALTGLYPPWAVWSYGVREFYKYGFLFDLLGHFSSGDDDYLHRPILLTEWLMIVAASFGLFLIFRDHPPLESTASVSKTSRVLLIVTITLAVLTLGLGATTYAANRRAKRLETGIQNMKAIIEADDPRSWGYFGKLSVLLSSPFRKLVPMPRFATARRHIMPEYPRNPEKGSTAGPGLGGT